MNLGEVLKGRRGRGFLPVVFRLAARMEQVAWSELFAEPAYLALALRNAQRALDLDAVLAHFDTTMEAEAAGVVFERDEEGFAADGGHGPAPRPPDSLPDPREVADRGRVPAVLEAASRLAVELDGRAALLGVVTGPLTLARWVGPDGGEGSEAAGQHRAWAAEVALRLAERFCRLGAGGLLVVEDAAAPPTPEVVRAHAGGLPPLLNLLRYFRVPAVLLWRGGLGAAAGEAVRAGYDMVGVSAPGDAPGHGLIAVPPEVFGGREADLGAWLGRPDGDLGYTSAWEVPPDAAAEDLRRAAGLLRA